MNNLPGKFPMTPQPWECPRCGRINAPFNPVCFCNPVKNIPASEKTYPNECDKVLIEKFEHEGNWFSSRTINCLRAGGITTIGQLLSWCKHQLLKIPNLGKKSFRDINETLACKNLKIGMNKGYSTTPGIYGSQESKCYNCANNEVCKDE